MLRETRVLNEVPEGFEDIGSITAKVDDGVGGIYRIVGNGEIVAIVKVEDGLDFFDLAAFKGILAKTPGIDNKSLTNLPKSFWQAAYKITPPEGSLIKTKIDKIIANGDPGGNLTEELIDDIFLVQGYKQADGKYFGETGNNGIDRVYYKGDISNPTELIAFEGKQMSSAGSAKLNDASTTTALPIQMTNDWLDYVATEKLLNMEGLQRQTGEAIITFGSQNIRKYVVAVDKISGQLYFLK